MLNQQISIVNVVPDNAHEYIFGCTFSLQNCIAPKNDVYYKYSKKTGVQTIFKGIQTQAGALYDERANKFYSIDLNIGNSYFLPSQCQSLNFSVFQTIIKYYIYSLQAWVIYFCGLFFNFGSCFGFIQFIAPEYVIEIDDKGNVYTVNYTTFYGNCQNPQINPR